MLSSLFGPPHQWPSRDLIGYSEEFDAQIVLEAYRSGVFPMPLEDDAMGWWSPMQRGLIPVDGVRVTRSLRKMVKRYTTTINTTFGKVMDRCGDPSRPGGWIDDRIRDVYCELHDAGWAHSVEVWDDDGALVGGLYGVHVGGLFAGESMFHDPVRGRDASKVALVRLAVELFDMGVELLDVQWLTEHLGTLGAYEIPRADYLARLSSALEQPTHPFTWVGRIPGDELINDHFELGASGHQS